MFLVSYAFGCELWGALERRVWTLTYPATLRLTACPYSGLLDSSSHFKALRPRTPMTYHRGLANDQGLFKADWDIPAKLAMFFQGLPSDMRRWRMLVLVDGNGTPLTAYFRRPNPEFSHLKFRWFCNGDFLGDKISS